MNNSVTHFVTHFRELYPIWPKVGHKSGSQTHVDKGVVIGWISDFFIVIFNFSITKLVYVPIFSLIG